jgi:hypothetical protein
LSPQPKYGILKGGVLPTYRQYIKSQEGENAEHLVKQAQIRNMAPKAHKPSIPKIQYLKKKKTIRRTFRVGRSKHYSKIGVLVNNKTIRNECSTKTHLLKQVPMVEVKKFLMKKGLIKVGTTAPNDVLRKIYESANLICGEVQNHNADILLHNYFHEGKI